MSWAGYLKNWNPSIDESPAAYIIILVNDKKNKWYARDSSFAASNISITAESYDIGTCVLCKIDREKIRDILKIPKNIIIDSVVALGYKDDIPVVQDIDSSFKYWLDENNVLYVPKRKLEDVIHFNKF